MAACLHLWLEEAQIQTIRFRADSPVRVYTSCSKNVFWQHAAYATTRHKDGTFLEWSFSLSFATDITLKVFFCFRKKKKNEMQMLRQTLQGPCLFTNNSCQIWWEEALHFTEHGYRTKTFGQHSDHTQPEDIILYLTQECIGLRDVGSLMKFHC